MAFDLTIHFWGLCMFVPDGGTVYVLLPSVGGDIPPHLAGLYVDPAYKEAGSRERAGSQERLAELKGWEVTFAGKDTDTPATTLPAELANVGAVAGLPVNTAVFDSNPGGVLNARVLLTAGSPLSPEPGVALEQWRYPPTDPATGLMVTVVWRIPGVEGDSLELTLTPLGEGNPVVLHTLYPIDGGIQISVYHTAEEELPMSKVVPTPLPRGKPAKHFAAFYSLLDPPPAEADCPLPVSDAPSGTGGVADIKPVNFGEVAYTCMGPAQGAPG